MQKLMAEPYVIRCFNNSSQESGKGVMESRRKELEQRLEKEVERHNHRRVLEQVIVAQEEKEQRMKEKVRQILEQSNTNLEERRRRRNEAKEMRNSMLSSSQLIASDGRISIESPRFASNRSRPHQRTQIHSTSSFELQEDEGRSFHVLKREILDEE
jgi:hypothetical protein